MNPVVEGPDTAGESKLRSAAPTIHVVAGLIWQPRCRDSFLISKRLKGKHLEDYWELPGGKTEAGETPLQALQRELIEEVNIMPLDASPYIQVFHSYEDRNILLDVWEVKTFKGSAKALEGQEVIWVAISELDQFRFPDADVAVLDAIKSNALV
jgi:8-oxo-dGTP diphosphatase